MSRFWRWCLGQTPRSFRVVLPTGKRWLAPVIRDGVLILRWYEED
jgi:hypothetical protein